jgi:predicted metal-dependent peptidase
MSRRLARFEDLPTDERQRWAASRVWAAHQAPYLATALLALTPVVVDQSGEHPTRRHDLNAFPADDRWHVYVDPEVLAKTDTKTLGFWLIHQATHLLRHHASRFPAVESMGGQSPPLSGRTKQQVRWNLASDAEIDDDLRAGDVVVPDRAVTPAWLGLPDDWLAEQYWDALAAETDRDAEGADCGSGCDGCGRPWDCTRAGLSALDRKLLGRDVARRIREHQRARGNVPAGWQRWADDVLEPVVDWRRALAAAVRRGVADTAGRVDFTYRRPSRRATVVPEVIFPALRQPLPHVAVVIDTSGSMSDQMLAQALGEVGGVLGSVGVARHNLRVVCCDARAYEAQRVLDARDVRLAGGGGTDMGAGLAAAAELRPRPDLVVVLTDGHTPWPPAAPKGTRVVVGLMDPFGSVPEWATSVSIEPTGAPAGW